MKRKVTKPTTATKFLCRVGKFEVYVHTSPLDIRRYSVKQNGDVIIHKYLFDHLPIDFREDVAKAIHAMER